MHEPDQHASPIKNWKQLVVIVALAFVVPVAVIVILSQYVTGKPAGATNDDSAVLNRIKPVGEVQLEAAPMAAVPAAAPVATATTPASSKPDGRKIYDATCAVCHGAGVAGAPKFGDKAAWAPRLKTGIDALVASALNGKAAMPAKGGNVSLPDVDVKAAVDYMVAAAR